MAIPLISNVGFTEVDSSGSLNTKAGDRTKLPIQFFRLSDNISGNLSLDNNSAHKKIILDTNGNNITNSSGSPLTTNSSTALELKGSGNVQSTLKTFTSSQSSTSNSGTTTISEADNSTVLVGTDHTFTSNLTSFGGQAIGGVFTSLNNTTYKGYVGGDLMPNVNSANFRMEFNDAFVEDNPPGGGLIVGPGGASSQSNYTSNAGRNCSPVEPASNTVSNGIRTMSWSSAGFDPRSGTNYNVGMTILNGNFYMTISSSSGAFDARFSLLAGGVIPNAITNTGRKFTFTNNLAISCALSGSDPFSATVSAGATNVVTRDSTDGSFSLTGTISGSDGSSRPFALKDMNDGSGSVDETAYTGTKSVSAF